MSLRDFCAHKLESSIAFELIKRNLIGTIFDFFLEFSYYCDCSQAHLPTSLLNFTETPVFVIDPRDMSADLRLGYQAR